MKKYELTQNTKITNGHTLYQIRALIDIPQKNIKAGDLGGYIQFEYNLSHEDTCWVADEACVWGNAQIYDEARVSGEAWVYENARVFGNAKIFDNAKVFGTAEVWDRAQVRAYAEVSGNARVLNNSRVFGNAQVFDMADVFDKARIYGYANVRGNASVYGNAQIFGKAHVFGNTHVYGNAQVSGKAEISGKAALIGGNWTQTPINIIGLKHNICQCDTNSIKIGCTILTFNEWLEEFEEIGYDNECTDNEIKEYKFFIDAIINVNSI